MQRSFPEGMPSHKAGPFPLRAPRTPLPFPYLLQQKTDAFVSTLEDCRPLPYMSLLQSPVPSGSSPWGHNVLVWRSFTCLPDNRTGDVWQKNVGHYMSLLGPRGLFITGQDKSKLWKKEAFLWSQTGLSNIPALNLFHIVTTIYRKEGKVSTHFSFYFH